MTTPAEHPVVVVGAGMAGLVAARELRRRDIEVLVVEAANRPGGRAMSETTQLGSRVDLGGQWIGHDHGRLRALADELGVAYYQMHTRALPVLVDGPRRIRMTSVAPALVAFAGAELVSRMRPRARWSDVTVEAWLRRVPGSRVRRLLEVVAWVSWTADLDRFSVRSMAEMIRLQGGLATALTTRGGAQDSLLVDGVGALIDAMAAELGARLRLGERVTSIAQQPDGVTVTTASGSVTAAKVIVTTAPPIAARIDYQPPLPPVLADLQRRSYMGSVYKAIAVYDDPFWRGRGSGELIVLDNPGRSVFDTSPPGGPGHLCVLVAGPEARALDALSENDRRHAVLGTVALHLGSEILSPRSWHEKAWHRDEYVEGGYMAIPEPGSAARLPMPSSPSGNIHWAGTETASEHPGYLEGAIESGVRASGEVIAALGA